MLIEIYGWNKRGRNKSPEGIFLRKFDALRTTIGRIFAIILRDSYDSKKKKIEFTQILIEIARFNFTFIVVISFFSVTYCQFWYFDTIINEFWESTDTEKEFTTKTITYPLFEDFTSFSFSNSQHYNKIYKKIKLLLHYP